MIKVHEANVSSMNPFFQENGFLEKDGNNYRPTAAVLEFQRAFSWNAETATQKLAPIINNSWFGQALNQHLQFRALTEDEAIEVLAEACNAGPEAKPQLRALIDFCDGAGVLIRANGQLSEPPMAKLAGMPPPTINHPPAPSGWPSEVPKAPTAPAAGAGAINLEISISANLAEMRDWDPDRISKFFAGIAQVLAAKNQDG